MISLYSRLYSENIASHHCRADACGVAEPKVTVTKWLAVALTILMLLPPLSFLHSNLDVVWKSCSIK